MAGFKLESMVDEDPSSDLARRVSARVAERGLDRSLFNARFDVRVQSIYTICLGAGAIVIALLLQLLFRKQARPYGAHLIFALHYVSFMYLITAAAGASRAIGVSTDVAVMSAFALIVPYLIVALKRVYLEANGPILLKAGALLRSDPCGQRVREPRGDPAHARAGLVFSDVHDGIYVTIRRGPASNVGNRGGARCRQVSLFLAVCGSRCR